jgi:hypothetical protein
MAEPESPPSGSVDDLEPMGRDRVFVIKLVVALVLGLVVAALVGWKIKTSAAGCGAGLIRPGSSVIPSESLQQPAR